MCGPLICRVSDFQRPIAVVESETNPIFALKSLPSVGNRAVAVVMYFPCFVTVQHNVMPNSSTSYVPHFLCPSSNILELIAISVLIFGSFGWPMVTSLESGILTTTRLLATASSLPSVSAIRLVFSVKILCGDQYANGLFV